MGHFAVGLEDVFYPIETFHWKNTACYLLCNSFFYYEDGGAAMTELEKCMMGEYYNCHDKIFLDIKSHARTLLQKYNALAYEQKTEKINILKQLFGGIGTNVSVGLPFICDYGRNIYV